MRVAADVMIGQRIMPEERAVVVAKPVVEIVTHAALLADTGERFELTRERVRQIKEKAIRRLRHATKSQSLKNYLG